MPVRSQVTYTQYWFEFSHKVHVIGFAKLIDPGLILARVLPCVRDLSQDNSQHVRAALAIQISGLAPLLGKDATIEHLLPLFLHLLKDEFPDVRLNIISKLELVNSGETFFHEKGVKLNSMFSVIGIELLSQSLLPAIVELAEDKQWRVRQAIIEYIPLLATQLGRTFFDEQLGNLCLGWLADHVYSIREAAMINLQKLTQVFGVEWARTTIIPKVLAMSTHPSFLFRMTTVLAITVRVDVTLLFPVFYTEFLFPFNNFQTIAPTLTLEVLCDDILDPLLRLANDPIPNIRFNVAKSLNVIGTKINEQPEGSQIFQKRISPTVERLKNDSDADVRYFASRAAVQAQRTVAAGK